jgi:hypothetical protein
MLLPDELYAERPIYFGPAENEEAAKALVT